MAIVRRPLPEFLGSMLSRSVTIGLLRPQHRTRNTRASVLPRLDGEIAADHGASMLHEPQANPLADVRRRLHADAGVLHFQHEPPVHLFEADPDGAGLGMT